MSGVRAFFAELGDRYRTNIRAIGERAQRVLHRAVPREKMPGSTVILIVVFCFVAALVVGFAFDTVSVQRSRAVPVFIGDIFGFISWMGKSMWELYPAGIIVVILLAGRWSAVPKFVRAFWAEFGALSAFLFASIGGVGLLVNIVKQPIGRGRPVTFDLVGTLGFHPFSFDYDFQSFPSGHSATAGALIAFGFLVARRWRVGLLVFGLLIGASRVVVGAHYPSDVLAGLLLGYGFSIWLAYGFADRGWAFSLDTAGTIRARAACLRRGFTAPGRLAQVFAGLADAFAGRPVWLPELKPIGVRPHGDDGVERQRGLDE